MQIARNVKWNEEGKKNKPFLLDTFRYNKTLLD